MCCFRSFLKAVELTSQVFRNSFNVHRGPTPDSRSEQPQHPRPAEEDIERERNLVVVDERVQIISFGSRTETKSLPVAAGDAGNTTGASSGIQGLWANRP